jgi:hypothetical protein
MIEIEGKNEVKFSALSPKEDQKAFIQLCKMTVYELSQTYPTQVDGTFKKYYEVTLSK